MCRGRDKGDCNMCVTYLPPLLHVLPSSLLNVWLPLTSTLSGSKVTLTLGDVACHKSLAHVWEFLAEALLSFPVFPFLEDMRDLSLHIHPSHNPLHWFCSQNNFPKTLPETRSIFCVLPNEWHRQKLNYFSERGREDSVALFPWAT